jgi:hypothetical protein
MTRAFDVVIIDEAAQAVRIYSKIAFIMGTYSIYLDSNILYVSISINISEV